MRQFKASLFILLLVSSTLISIPISMNGTGADLHVGPDRSYNVIQDAIDNATDGDIVLVDSYTFEGNILINKSITLKGNGSLSKIISDENVVIRVSASNVNITGLNITGNNENHGIVVDSGVTHVNIFNISISSVNDGIYCRGNYMGAVNNITVRNSSVKDVYRYAITTFNSRDIILENNKIHSNYIGIGQLSVERSRIENNWIESQNNGIESSQGHSEYIGNNTITSSQNATYIAYKTDVLVYNNEINGAEFGINIRKSDNINCSLNSIKNGYAGIYSWNDPLGIEIMKNNITNMSRYGIYLSGTTIAAENNTISNCGFPSFPSGHGLECPSGNMITINNNSFTGCSPFIQMRYAKKLASIDGNIVDGRDFRYFSYRSDLLIDEDLSGIILSSGSNFIIRNQSFSNASMGIYSYLTNGLTIENCSFDGLNMGMHAYKCSGSVKIVNCSFEKTSNPFKITGGGNADYSLKNVFFDSCKNGVTYSGLTPFYNSLSLLNNTFTNIDNDAISIEKIKSLIVTGNKIANTSCSINLDQTRVDSHGSMKFEWNTIKDCFGGISLRYVNTPLIRNNTIENIAGEGVILYRSGEPRIGNNTIVRTEKGIMLDYGSGKSKVYGNRIIDASESGIELSGISQANFWKNNLTSCGFFGYKDNWRDNHFDESNLINTRPLIVRYNTNTLGTTDKIGQLVLHSCSNMEIEDENLSGFSVGIFLYGCTDITFENCSVDDNRIGATVYSSDRIVLINSSLKGDRTYGLYITNSDDFNMDNCSIESCAYPTFEEGEAGIQLSDSKNFVMENSSFTSCGLEILYYSGNTDEITTHTISNTTVNDRKLYYISERSDMVIDGDAGQIIIVESHNITIEGQNLSDSSIGVLAYNSYQINISNCIVNGNKYGIRLHALQDDMDQVCVKGCYINDSKVYGIYLMSHRDLSSDHYSITNNSLEGNSVGIYGKDMGSSFKLENNSILGSSTLGIEIRGKSDVTGMSFKNNTVIGSHDGVNLVGYSYSTVKDNRVEENAGYGIYLIFFERSQITSNVACNNGKEGIIDSSGDMNLIKNNTLSGNWIGLFTSADSGRITVNNISFSTGHGLYLTYSNNNMIDNNTFYLNAGYGVYSLSSSSYYNKFIFNEFLWNNRNRTQAFEKEGGNHWYRNGKGNYWTDHQSPDLNRDGIVDIGYDLDNDGTEKIDEFPLVIGNIPPLLEIINNITLYTGESLNLTVNASDINGDRMNFTHGALPEFVSFNLTTGLLEFSPMMVDIGNHTITIRVEDGYGGTDEISFIVTILNSEPEIITTPPLIAHEDSPYMIDMDANERDDDILTWSIESSAGFLEINSVTGVIQGTPDNDDIGQFWVEVKVEDTLSGADSINYTLTVINQNDDPVILTEDILEVMEDSLLLVSYLGYDPDPVNDTLLWSMITDAGFLEMNENTGNLSGTPSNDDVGVYWVNITLSDGNGGIDFTNFTLEVFNVNDDPEIISIPSTSLDEDDFYVLDLTASDPDPTDDVLSWYLHTNADFLELDEATGVVTGSPSNDQVGDWYVNISVSDGIGGADWLNFTLTVHNVNDNPTILMDQFYEIMEDERISIDLIAEDIDPTEDVLSWTMMDTNAPFIRLENENTIIVEASNHEVGEWYALISVEDGNGGYDELNVTFSIMNVNDPPLIERSPLPDGLENEEYSFIFTGTDIDPEGDLLTWQIRSSAGFLSLDRNTGELTGIPENGDNGVYWINISLFDGEEGMDWFNTTLAIQSENVQFHNIDGNWEVTIKEDSTFDFDLEVGFFLSPISGPVDHTGENHLSTLISDGIATITPEKDWSGDTSIIFSTTVLDEILEFKLDITILPVDDPPQNVDIHMTEGPFQEGTPIEMNLDVNDPDGGSLDQFTIIWNSNISGEIGQGQDLILDLPAGYHLITVTMTDDSGLEYSDSVELNIIAQAEDQDDDDDDDVPIDEGNNDETTSIGYIIVPLIILILVIALVLYIFYRKRGKESDHPVIEE